jgi:hypothetical protein
VYGVLLSVVVAVLITLPAIVKVDIPVGKELVPSPVAFVAVVSIGVVGLYVAFAIPIYLRWKAADTFTPGAWTLGKKYKWMCIVAVAEIAITSFIAILPTSAAGAPWYKGFGWANLKFVNYTPVVVGVMLLLLWLGWHLSAKKWFTGPKMTIGEPVAREHEVAPEFGGRT